MVTFSKNNITFLILIIFFIINISLSAISIGDLNLYFTNEFTYNNNNLANDENQFYNIFSLFSNYKRFSFSLSLRGNNFFKQTPNISFEDMKYDAYKKLISYNSRDLSISVGDFNSLLGRGLVLSVLKNTDVLNERSIMGGNIRYSGNKVNINLLGGKVENDIEDQEWIVFGGEFILKFFKKNYFGLHFSFIDDIDTWRDLGERYTYSFSLKGNMFNKFSYFVEIASLNFADSLIKKGYGVFSKFAYNSGKVSIFTEYKKYSNFDNEMNSPPVADKSDEVVVLKDSEGIRLFFEYSFMEPDISLFFNLGWYREYENSGLHYYGGFSIDDLWERFSLNMSYGIKELLYPIKKIDADIVIELTDSFSLELSLKDKRYSDGLFKFNEKDINVQLNILAKFSIHFLYQYSHNKIIGLNDFYSGGINYNINDTISLEISGGTIRGGTICSGGQCYVKPPFRGIKLAFLMTFI